MADSMENVPSAELSDALQAGFQAAMERISELRLASSSTLVDGLSQEDWDNWDGFNANPIVIDCNGMSDDDDVEDDVSFDVAA